MRTKSYEVADQPGIINSTLFISLDAKTLGKRKELSVLNNRSI